MPAPYPLGETITILRPGAPTQDDYGNDVPGADEENDVPGCAVWPRSSDEDNRSRQQVTQGLNVVAPYGTDIRPADRVQVRGLVYTVDGEPGSWRSPLTGTEGGVQVSLTRVTG
jgi:hypothetical protein